MIIRIFAATESATLPIWTANQGGSFAFMGTLRLYTKQALSISEQIELLKSRDLNIADSSKAAKFLGEVSYFRFVQYLRPMEADKSTHQFKPNSRFEDAVALFLEEVASCLLFIFISMIFKEFCDVRLFPFSEYVAFG